MIHIWLPNAQASLRIWQDNNQQWQTAENWQEINTLVSFANKNKHRTACLYFPSLHLLHTSPNLTNAQLKTLGEAGKRYLFEDISINTVDDLQVKVQLNQTLPTLYALHGAERDQWLQSASLAGIEIVALLPDFLLLSNDKSNKFSETAQQAIFYQDQHCQLLRFGQAGMSVTYLPLLLDKLNNIETFWVSGQVSKENQQFLEKFTEVLPADFLPTPVKDPNRHWLNFAVIKRDNKTSPYLKVVASMMVLAIIMGLVVDGLRWFYYEKATEQTKEMLVIQYNQWFPNENLNPRLNLQRQLESKLIRQQSTDDSLLTTLVSLQSIFQKNQTFAKNLSYANNHLQLQIVTADSNLLNHLINQLNEQGIQAKLGSVNTIAGETIASLQIQL